MDYKGFGNPKWVLTYLSPLLKHVFYVAGEEYWMGLENIYQITNSKSYTLRITMKSFGAPEKKIAMYKAFKLTENVI